MSDQMAARFSDVGLPYRMTDQALLASTLDAHRVLVWTGELGPAAQDAAAEVLFHAYFAEEKAPNDAAVLVRAAALTLGVLTARLVRRARDTRSETAGLWCTNRTRRQNFEERALESVWSFPSVVRTNLGPKDADF